MVSTESESDVKRAHKSLKRFSDIMMELDSRYPKIPLVILQMQFQKYRAEHGKLSGKPYRVIMNELTMRLNHLQRQLSTEDIKYVAAGAAPIKR